MKNCVSIILKTNQIVIKVNENASREEIIRDLKSKLPELKKFYKEEKTPILVTGKILKIAEMNEIQELIKKEIKVKVDFDSPNSLGLHGIKKVFKKDIATSETKFYKSSLRSGQKVEFEGSIVILGDVNGGAEVLASDNIVVLGTLRGLAHAGANGNSEAIIAAHLIETPQIRIANVIKERSREEVDDQIVTYAYIDDNNEITLE